MATAVALARARGLAPFTGLVNAVLRRVAERGGGAGGAGRAPAGHAALALGELGAEARAIATAHATEAPLDLTVQGAAPPGGTVLPTGSVRYPAGTRVTELPGFDAGAFWVQDAAAALPARLLAAQPGERVADLCAAPGGKAAQLAATGATVIAVERDASARPAAREPGAAAAAGDDRAGGRADLAPAAPLDAVLLDAPCSATGTIRRHPDVPHLKRARTSRASAEQQRALIAAAAAMLRPGGRLVYAVCSLQPEEGPDALRAAARPGCGIAVHARRTARRCPRRARPTAACAPIPACGRSGRHGRLLRRPVHQAYDRLACAECRPAH